MSARVASGRPGTGYQSLHHFVAGANWSDKAMLDRVRALVSPIITRHQPIQACVVEDLAFEKKGTDSVGVTRQWCPPLRRRANCQIAVTLWVANDHATLPIGYRLYLPSAWASEAKRRGKAGVPDDLPYQTRAEIALAELTALAAAGLSMGVVLARAEYGCETAFCAGLSGMGRPYAVEVDPSKQLWTKDSDQSPVSANELASALPDARWREARWRDSLGGEFASRFAGISVSRRDPSPNSSGSIPDEWLLLEWRGGHAAPRGFWATTLPKTMPFADIMRRVSLRCRVQRDAAELSQKIGLAHYEGRGWRGFHHHGTLCIAAYAFLIAEGNRR